MQTLSQQEAHYSENPLKRGRLPSIGPDFFDKPTLSVARRLLGAILTTTVVGWRYYLRDSKFLSRP